MKRTGYRLIQKILSEKDRCIEHHHIFERLVRFVGEHYVYYTNGNIMKVYFENDMILSIKFPHGIVIEQYWLCKIGISTKKNIITDLQKIIQCSAPDRIY